MEPIFPTVDEATFVILRTTSIFLVAFFALRFLGKRHLSRLMYTDLMVIIAFGSAVGDVMIYAETVAHFYGSVLAIVVVTVIVKVLEEVSSHNKFASQIIDGSAVLLIDNGRIVAYTLEHENLSEDMVSSLLREKGYNSISEIQKAFIEPDGQISVVPKK
jgi:uncharacterized membrane protein YcaP (DUF421 family)